MSGLFFGLVCLLLIPIAAGAQVVASSVTFSRPVPDLFPDEPFVTCLIGNFEEPSHVHNWKLRYRGAGLQNVDLTVVATTINTEETGAIKAIVVDQNGVQSVTVPFPPLQGDNFGSLHLTINGGQVYDLKLERIDPSEGRAAHHYKLGSPDKRLELGWEDPLRYLENHDQLIAVNADANEDVSMDVFADPPDAAFAPQATSLTITVKNADCGVIIPSTAFPLPGRISIPGYAGGTLIIDIEHGDGHFRMRKNSGSDRGFYMLPCPPPPKIICPANIVVVTDPDRCDAKVTFTVTASGKCGPLPVDCRPPSGFTFPLGTTTVFCTTGEGDLRAVCSFTVTVRDNQPPRIICPPDMVVNNEPGKCGATVQYATPKVFDTCGPVTFKCEPPSGFMFPNGTTTVTCTAIDQAGNQASCKFTVTVLDKEPPKIICPPDIVVGNDPGQCSAVVNYKPMATDNCGPVTIVCNPPPGSVFPKGTTTVTCTAKDEAGNTASCSFTVTVKDLEAPVAECTPTTNPDGKNIPTAGENPKSGQNPDGFYQLSGGDNCDAPGAIAIYIKDSASDFVAGPFKDGDKVKITQAPGVTPNQKKMAGVVVAHIQLQGDALVYGVDSSGNVSKPHTCLVPPKPK